MYSLLLFYVVLYCSYTNLYIIVHIIIYENLIKYIITINLYSINIKNIERLHLM